MTNSILATLFAATLFSASAAMANTSADTAPDRLPALTSSTSLKSVPSAAESAAIASMAWEGGQAGSQVRPSVTAQKPMARSAAMPSPSLLAGAPYQSGAAN
jgi:hypothetical protein